nr:MULTISPECIES: preprotein translocase subunit YajC [Chitinibacter]
MFITPAYAAAAPAEPSAFMSFLPMIVIFVIFWFLMIRPQQKKAKEHQAMLTALQKGDEVVTNGGIVGRIVKIKEQEQYLSIEIADGVEIVIQRAAIALRVEKGTLKNSK